MARVLAGIMVLAMSASGIGGSLAATGEEATFAAVENRPVAVPAAAGPTAPVVPQITGPYVPLPSAPKVEEPSAQAAPLSSPTAPTLLPMPEDASRIDEVELPARRAAVISAESSWDDGFIGLSETFRKLDNAIIKSGLTVAGRPMAVFRKTDDKGFHFDAMIPVSGDLKDGAQPQDFRLGETPTGKALRFIHKAPYDDIDSAYEGITAYLDIRDIVAKEEFIEEYATDLTTPEDEALEVNIYVSLRDASAPKSSAPKNDDPQTDESQKSEPQKGEPRPLPDDKAQPENAPTPDDKVQPDSPSRTVPETVPEPASPLSPVVPEPAPNGTGEANGKTGSQ